MSNYPPGCTGTPFDDVPEPSEMSMKIQGILEDADLDPSTIDMIVGHIDSVETDLANAIDNLVGPDQLRDLIKRSSSLDELEEIVSHW